MVDMLLYITTTTFLIFINLFHGVQADVTISSPTSDKTYTAVGGSVTVPLKWFDDSNYPPLDKIESYTFSLCYGPNTDISNVYTIGKQIPSTDITVTTNGDSKIYSYDSVIPASIVGNGQFYIQVYAVVKGQQGDTIHYSPRFSLSGMTGAATFTYTYSTQPPAITEIHTGDSNNGGTTINSASFSIPYTLQTGKTRYAPMQMQPGSKVTATTWTRKFPTSKVTFYSTYRKSLDQVSTITPGRSYAMTSDINFASPALMPSANGGWYNPSKRLSLTPKKIYS